MKNGKRFELAKFNGKWAVYDPDSMTYSFIGKGKQFCKKKVDELNGKPKVKKFDFYLMKKRLHLEMLGAIIYLFEKSGVREIDFMPLGEFQSHCFVIISRDGAESTEEVKVSKVKCVDGLVFVRPFAEEEWISCEFAGKIVTATLDNLYEEVYRSLAPLINS